MFFLIDTPITSFCEVCVHKLHWRFFLFFTINKKQKTNKHKTKTNTANKCMEHLALTKSNLCNKSARLNLKIVCSCIHRSSLVDLLHSYRHSLFSTCKRCHAYISCLFRLITKSQQIPHFPLLTEKRSAAATYYYPCTT